MVYITGDTHGEFNRLSTRIFPEQKELSRNDILIICGDFGGIWYNDFNPSESYWLKWLSEKPFTICYVDGNHENYDRYYSDEFEIVDFHGGKAHKIRDNIYHLMRGYIFDFEDKKFFAMGGASSHDVKDGILDPADYPSQEALYETCRNLRKAWKQFRVKGVSWWQQEIPSQEELDLGFKNLKENDFKVDYVITHCLPQSIASLYSLGDYKSDKLTDYFQMLLDNGLTFDTWWSGHYHCDVNVIDNFNIIYKKIIRII